MRNTVTTSLVLRASGGSVQTVPSSRYTHTYLTLYYHKTNTCLALCSAFTVHINKVLYACNI